MDVPEAATMLGISKEHAYRSIERGEFPARTIRVGRRIKVVTADLMAVLGASRG
jgi:excisionase family DNA binding protein